MKNLLDSSSLKGQQARHQLGIHFGQVCLGDVCHGTQRRLLELSGESQGEGLGQRIDLTLLDSKRGRRTGNAG